jgi:7,8-dihydroneopterin aldolase/epimerase/oxygenase
MSSVISMLVMSPDYNGKITPMDIIFLADLRIDTVIGIFDWERRIKQTVIFDVEMAADIKKAAASDSIDDTLDYKAVAKRIIQFVEESEFQLVETLAEKVAQLILNEFKVPWVRLKLNKSGAIRGASGVGIQIERGQR